MSASYKVALAIDKSAWPMVSPFLSDITEGYQSYDYESPDNTYRCVYWDEINWAVPAVFPLLKRLETLRHSLITVNKDEGRIERDVLTEDEWGVDEEFEEVLSYSTDIMFWDEEGFLTPVYPYSPRCEHHIPISRDRVIRILSEYVTNDYSATESGYIYDALSMAGASNHEIEALGFGYCIPDEE